MKHTAKRSGAHEIAAHATGINDTTTGLIAGVWAVAAPQDEQPEKATPKSFRNLFDSH